MFISLDLETTGFDPEKDQIIEFGAIKFDLEGSKESLQILIHPEREIPEIVTLITKIKDTDVVNAPTFAEKKDEIEAFIGDLPIVGHNIQFDTNFLRAKGVPLKNKEYDTHVLAGMLLQNMPSYSLEVISHTLGLMHEDKHRALDDAIAAMELFQELVKRFQNLPEKLIQKIQTLCQKSDWDVKDLILTLNHKPQTLRPILDPRPLDDAPSNYKKILAETNSGLFEEIPPYENLIKDLSVNASPNTYITLPYQIFKEVEIHIPDNISKIDSYRNYISQVRLEEFERQEHYDNDEISALLKYLIWIEETKTGLLSELRIFGKEKKTYDKVRVNENGNTIAEKFIKKALEKDEKSAAISTHQYIIENSLPKGSDLIVLDLDQFKKTLHRHLSIYLKLDIMVAPLQFLQELHPQNQSLTSLINKSEMLFGIVENIFEKHNDQNEYSPRCNSTPEIRDSQEWKNCQDLSNSLIQISKELGEISTENTQGYLQNWKANLKGLHSFFFDEGVKFNLRWIDRDYRTTEVTLRKIPKSTDEEMQEIFNNCSSYKIIGENLESTSTELDLPLHNFTTKAENIEIEIISDLANHDSKRIIKYIAEEMKNTPQKAAMIFNAKKQLHIFTLELNQLETPIVSQLISSTGKLKAQFKQNVDLDQSVLALMTPNVWEQFDHHKDVDHLFIHKIPFDPPSDPEIIAASEGKVNPFIEVQIPKAVNALIKMINRLHNSSKSLKKVTIFDSRISNLDYGKLFTKKLKEVAELRERPLVKQNDI